MKTTLITRSAVLGLALAGTALALAGCGTPTPVADPAATKACQMVQDSHNDYVSALWTFNKSETEVNRSNAQFYLDLRPSQMQDAYETAPLTMRADVKNLAEMAELIKRLPGDRTGVGAYNLTLDDVSQECIQAGVPIRIFNWDTGQIEDVQAEAS